MEEKLPVTQQTVDFLFNRGRHFHGCSREAQEPCRFSNQLLPVNPVAMSRHHQYRFADPGGGDVL